jgi:hypothetical protein
MLIFIKLCSEILEMLHVGRRTVIIKLIGAFLQLFLAKVAKKGFSIRSFLSLYFINGITNPMLNSVTRLSDYRRVLD